MDAAGPGVGSGRLPLDGGDRRGRRGGPRADPGQGGRRCLSAARRGEAGPADAAGRRRWPARDGLPGAVMDPVLIARLGIWPSATASGWAPRRSALTAALPREPDGGAGSFTLGPRTIVRTADLAASGLLAPGTLFETDYRLLLPPGHGDRDAVHAAAEEGDRGRRLSLARRARRRAGDAGIRRPAVGLPGADRACRAGGGRRRHLGGGAQLPGRASAPPSPR